MWTGLHRAPPKLWPWLEEEEVRGLTSVALPTDMTGTTFEETVKVPPVPGMQNLLARQENGSGTVSRWRRKRRSRNQQVRK